MLDWSKGFAFDDPEHRVGYTLRRGVAAPAEFQFIETPSAKAQQVLMMEDFAHLVRNVDDEGLREASIGASEHTQALLDVVWGKASQESS